MARWRPARDRDVCCLVATGAIAWRMFVCRVSVFAVPYSGILCVPGVAGMQIGHTRFSTCARRCGACVCLCVCTLCTHWLLGVQVVLIDERFELMLIFWSTIAIFQHNFGATIKATLTDSIAQIKKYAREHPLPTVCDHFLTQEHPL